MCRDRKTQSPEWGRFVQVLYCCRNNTVKFQWNYSPAAQDFHFPIGIVGRATWNKLVSLYVGILRLAELESEGQQLFGASLEYPDAISEGDTGEKVRVLQYFLSVLSDFYVDIPFVTIDGIFGPQTKNAVIAFQRANNLPETGVVGDETWDVMYNQYQGIVTTTLLNNRPHTVTTEPYPNEVLRLGSTGTSVTTLQQYLDTIATVYNTINRVMVTGIFGQPTREAVIAFQRQFGLPATGRVNEDTWYMIQEVYKDALSATNPSPTQYPGQPLTLGTTDQPRNS